MRGAELFWLNIVGAGAVVDSALTAGSSAKADVGLSSVALVEGRSAKIVADDVAADEEAVMARLAASPFVLAILLSPVPLIYWPRKVLSHILKSQGGTKFFWGAILPTITSSIVLTVLST